MVNTDSGGVLTDDKWSGGKKGSRIENTHVNKTWNTIDICCNCTVAVVVAVGAEEVTMARIVMGQLGH